MNKRLTYFGCCLLLSIACPVAAERWCFISAQTYYEQIYCQVQAAGYGKALPALFDFRRNNEQMQALLLKRPAQLGGIAMVMPTSTVVKAPVKTNRAKAAALAVGLPHCERRANSIFCHSSEFQLVGNMDNDSLPDLALTPHNTMNLPEFDGTLSNDVQVAGYLRASYRHYLLKMIDIGLGGATLSYGKFAYLFDDLSRRGVAMAERFEAMYTYLKKDKQSMAVPSRSVAPAELLMGDCFSLESLIVCHVDRRNWLFRRLDRDA